MNVQDITSIVSTLGFPIVCCGSLFWYMLQRDKKEAERDEQHREEVAKLSEAINNNTIVMQQLVDNINNGSK